MFEYFLNMLAMFRYVIWVDKYIIQIDHDTDVQKVREEVIHELLKDCESIEDWRVLQTTQMIYNMF